MWGALALAVEVRKRVLVIEDSVYIRELLSDLLDAHGFDVTGAATGAEGIAAALRTHPDLIIVDLCLPDDYGLSVVRTLLSDAGLMGTPVIAISAFDAIQLRAEALEAGCVGYEMKPLDMERLVENVRLLTGA